MHSHASMHHGSHESFHADEWAVQLQALAQVLDNQLSRHVEPSVPLTSHATRRCGS